MPRVITPPTRTQLPAVLPRIRWTVEQYENLFTMGLLPEKGYELIEGDVIQTMPIKDAHSYVITMLFALMSRFCDFSVLRSQFSLWIDEESLPEPDFAVLLSPTPTRTERGYLQPADMHLVIEVSDATIDRDVTTKAVLYARAGIAEYWVIDVTGRRLLIHRIPVQDGYSQVTEYSETDTASPLFAPDATFNVSEILP